MIGNDFQASPLCSKSGGSFSHNRGGAGITNILNTGNPLNYPPTDYNGTPRPLGPAPDIGAYEKP